MPRHKGQTDENYTYDPEAWGAAIDEALKALEAVGIAANAVAQRWKPDGGSPGGTLSRVRQGKLRQKVAARERLIATLGTLAKENGLTIDCDRLRRIADVPLPTIDRRGFLARTMGGAAGLVLTDPPPSAPRQLWVPPVLGFGRRSSSGKETAKREESQGSVERSAALAKARLALSLEQQSRFDEAFAVSVEALRDLDLDDLPPEGIATPVEEILFALGDDEVGLEAYAELAKFRGLYCNVRGTFGPSQSAYETLVAVSRRLGNARLEADGWRYLGKALVERGTDVTEDDPAWKTEWRSATDPVEIDRGISCLGKAREVRPKSDELGLAEDWRQEARAWQTLVPMRDDDTAEKGAKRAEDGAMGCFGGANASEVHLRLDWARWQLVGVNTLQPHASDRHKLREAEQWFEGASALAREAGSGASLASALGGLGTIYSMTYSPSHPSALEHCIASLLAWPLDFDTRDSRKSLYLARIVGVSPRRLQEFRDGDSRLRDVLLQIPDLDLDRRIETVHRRLGWHRQ